MQNADNARTIIETLYEYKDMAQEIIVCSVYKPNLSLGIVAALYEIILSSNFWKDQEAYLLPIITNMSPDMHVYEEILKAHTQFCKDEDVEIF